MEIRIENITKNIKKNRVLSDVSAGFKSGNIYGIKGKNGSGKTMLLRAICGLLKSDSGIVTIDDKVIGVDIDFPESIGVFFEPSTFLGGMTAFENLKVIASIKGEATDSEIEDAIDRVGLREDAEKKYRQYSLGMRQKLGIAAAIMEKPKILLLDEPTNGLDDASVEKLKKILVEEKSRGAIVIFASHDFEELGELADEIFCMKEGKLEKI